MSMRLCSDCYTGKVIQMRIDHVHTEADYVNFEFEGCFKKKIAKRKGHEKLLMYNGGRNCASLR
jgi:hypothetical protein